MPIKYFVRSLSSSGFSMDACLINTKNNNNKNKNKKTLPVPSSPLLKLSLLSLLLCHSVLRWQDSLKQGSGLGTRCAPHTLPCSTVSRVYATGTCCKPGWSESEGKMVARLPTSYIGRARRVWGKVLMDCHSERRITCGKALGAKLQTS